MMITNDRARRGDILIFKRHGLLASILSWLLQKFEPSYDRWGWHVAIIEEVCSMGCWIIEAREEGVNIHYLSEQEFKTKCRTARLLKKKPTRAQMEKFLWRHIGEEYDKDVYIQTILQVLLWKLFKIRIGREFDRQQTCWELGAIFLREMGEPVTPIYRYPLITDFVK